MRLFIRLLCRVVFGTGTLLLLAGLALLLANETSARTYSSVVIDARNGKILISQKGNLRLHPASLTKMMTIYVAIQAVENGEINLDSMVRISKFAAAEPASKLYLKSGDRVSLRHLIRAAAVRSANDAATAIAEAISGSEKAFAARMNRTAIAMGMNKTTFKNAHGLTQSGHLSSARDMSILGQHLVYNYPEYYHLFSKRNADVGKHGSVRNTNRRFLNNFSGADGIKTGYTSKAGFNLTASAVRGNKRIIVTVFGGRSAKTRDDHVADLMNRGFKMVSDTVRHSPPPMPIVPFSQVTRIDMSVDMASKRILRPDTKMNNDLVVDRKIMESVIESQGDVDPEASPKKILIPKEVIDFGRPMRRDIKEINLNIQEIKGIQLGKFNSNRAAESYLKQASVVEPGLLNSAKKNIELNGRHYVARFVNISPETAQRACAKLNALQMECTIIYSS